MTGRARLLVLPLLVMLSCSAVPVASQRNEGEVAFHVESHTHQDLL